MERQKTNQTCQLLCAKELAKMLSLSKRQIFRMKSAGLICPCIKVGRGAIRWRQSDVEKWISMGCCSQKEFIARKEAENTK